MGQTRPLFNLFSVFSNKQYKFLQQIKSSIQHRYSNSQPFEHEPSPISTRPGLPPQLDLFVKRNSAQWWLTLTQRRWSPWCSTGFWGSCPCAGWSRRPRSWSSSPQRRSPWRRPPALPADENINKFIFICFIPFYWINISGDNQGPVL